MRDGGILAFLDVTRRFLPQICKGVPFAVLSTADADLELDAKFLPMDQPPRKISNEPNSPSERQLNYARTLGVAIRPGMSKQQVSAAIDRALRLRPRQEREGQFALEEKRQRAEAQRISRIGEEAFRLESHWDEYAQTTAWMLAIYRSGNSNAVDVLRVTGAIASDDRQIELHVVRPEPVCDHEIGDRLEWRQEFKLNLADLLHHEPLPRFDSSNVDSYRAMIDQGTKRACQLEK